MEFFNCILIDSPSSYTIMGINYYIFKQKFHDTIISFHHFISVCICKPMFIIINSTRERMHNHFTVWDQVMGKLEEMASLQWIVWIKHACILPVAISYRFIVRKSVRSKSSLQIHIYRARNINYITHVYGFSFFMAIANMMNAKSKVLCISKARITIYIFK